MPHIGEFLVAARDLPVRRHYKEPIGSGIQAGIQQGNRVLQLSLGLTSRLIFNPQLSIDPRELGRALDYFRFCIDVGMMDGSVKNLEQLSLMIDALSLK